MNLEKAWIIDIETTNLLSESIDYTAFPYKLKKEAKLWCVVLRNVATNEIKYAIKENITKDWIKENLQDCEYLIAHNGIKFDLPMLKLFNVLDYKIGYIGENDTIFGKNITIFGKNITIFGKNITILDSLILSRWSFPDRFGGHSLESWGERVKENKIDFRQECIDKGIISKDSLKGAEFQVYSDLMLNYCIQDTNVNAKLFKKLLHEIKDITKFNTSIKQENKLADLALNRETLGFKFDKELAIKCVEDLTNKMQDLANNVNPLLPPKVMNKTELKTYTPPKRQISKDGEITSAMLNFITKTEGFYEQKDNGDFYYIDKNNNEFKIPLEDKPIISTITAEITDLDHVKMHLISLGWKPTEWRERDLTKDSKKQSISYEKRLTALNRWYEETVNGKYTKSRLEKLELKISQLENWVNKTKQDLKKDKPIRVPTSPCVRVGVEKNLCPNLEKLGEKVAFAKDFTLYLTYKHRKSSIAGGDMEDMDFDNEYPNSGYLSMYRNEDGRIPTPAIEIGAASHRYRHIGVANIPRASSIYGKEMRSLFGCGEDAYQLGFDFSSLEARIMGHYVWEYEGGKELAQMFLAEKPNDWHTVTSIALNLSRTDTKSVNYACLPVENTEILTTEGWKYFNELKENSNILSYNTVKDCIEEDTINKIHYFENKEVIKTYNSRDSFESTSDHRWYGKVRRSPKNQKKYFENMFFTTKEINTEKNILMSSCYKKTDSNMTILEARMLGWILADGYFKWSVSSRNKKQGIVASISQSKNKYYKQLENDLKESNIKYKKDFLKKNNGNTLFSYRLDPNFLRNLLIKLNLEGKNKHEILWTKIILDMSEECRDNFIETFYLSDGNGGNKITQNFGNIQEAVTLALYLQGKRISVQNKTDKCSITVKHSTAYLTGQKLKKESIGVKPTFCITTNNSTFIIRQNKKFISITGNCVYGARGKKIAQMLGVSFERGEEILNGVWENAPALAALKNDLEFFWEQNGHIIGIDGRLIAVRSKHSILNTLFQSAGIICAKYVTVFLMEELENKKYCISPFISRPDVCSMTEYHDEIQLFINKKFIKYKDFDTKEEAEEIIKKWKGDKLSSISEINGKFRLYANNPVSKAIETAIKKTEKLLNLNVSLGFEWIAGKNWYECH